MIALVVDAGIATTTDLGQIRCATQGISKFICHVAALRELGSVECQRSSVLRVKVHIVTVGANSGARAQEGGCDCGRVHVHHHIRVQVQGPGKLHLKVCVGPKPYVLAILERKDPRCKNRLFLFFKLCHHRQLLWIYSLTRGLHDLRKRVFRDGTETETDTQTDKHCD